MELQHSTDGQLLLDLLGKLIGEGKVGQRFYASAATISNGNGSGALMQEISADLGQQVDLLRKKWRLLSHRLEGSEGNGERIVYEEYAGDYHPIFEVDPVSLDDLVQLRLPPTRFYRAEDFEEINQATNSAQVLRLAMRIERRAFQYLSRVAEVMRTSEGQDEAADLAQDRRQRYRWLRRKYLRLPPRPMY
jgi:hypothetical protein